MSKNKGSNGTNRPALAIAKKTVSKELLATLKQTHQALTEAKIVAANARLTQRRADAAEQEALQRCEAAHIAFEEAAAAATRSIGGDPNDPKQKWNIQLDSGAAERLV